MRKPKPQYPRSQTYMTVPMWLYDRAEHEKSLLSVEPGKRRGSTIGFGTLSLMMYFAINERDRLRLAKRFMAEQMNEDAVKDILSDTWPYQAVAAIDALPQSEREYFCQSWLRNPVRLRALVKALRDAEPKATQPLLDAARRQAEEGNKGRHNHS